MGENGIRTVRAAAARVAKTVTPGAGHHGTPRLRLVVPAALAAAIAAVIALSMDSAPPARAATSGVASQVSHYDINNGSNFYRSTGATSMSISSGGTASQTVNGDGSVTLSISGTSGSGYADDGFDVAAGTLGDLNGILAKGSGAFGLNLWFDTGGDGQFFAWNSSGEMTGLSGDSYILGPSSTSGVESISGSSQFTSLQPGGGNYTLAQLKAGDASGITSSTPVAVWVGVTSTGSDASATISSLFISSGTIRDTYANPSYTAASAAADGHIYGVDAFSSIGDAENAVASGGTVHLPAGTVTSGTVEVTKPITIQGAGESQTTLDLSGAASYGIHITADNVTVEDLRIQGPTGTSGYGLKIADDNNVTVTDVTVQGSHRTGIDLNSVNGATLTDVTSKDAGYGNGISLTDSRNITIDGATTSGNAWGGIALYAAGTYYAPCGVDNVSLTNLSLGETAAVYTGIDGSGTGCKVTNLSLPSSYLPYKVTLNQGDPQDIYVKSLGDATTVAKANSSLTPVLTSTSDGSYWVTSGFKIQDAVNAAGGGTVNIAAGTYAEKVTIAPANNGLVLQGAGSTTTSITGGILFDATSDITGVTVKGLEVTGNSGSATVSQSGSGYLYNLDFDQDVFDGQGSVGMGMYLGAAAGTFSLTNSEVTGYTNWGTIYIGETTLDAGPSGPSFTTVTFQGDNIHDNKGSNVVYGNADKYTTSFIIKDNHFTNNGNPSGNSWASIEAHNTLSVVSEGNVYDGQVESSGFHEGAALYLQNDNNSTVHATSTDDQFLDNFVGVELWAGNANGVKIRNAVFSGNGKPTLVCTTCHDTADSGASIGPATGTIDATGNWWGTAAGPGTIANTTATPWCMDDSCSVLSNSADLTGLSLSSGTLDPAFSSATTSYTASVDHSVTSLTVSDTASTGATATVTGGSSLSVGANTVKVAVTSADGTATKTYTVTVTRGASSDASLTGLSLSSGTLSPAFASGTTAYTASVGNSVGSVTVTATPVSGATAAVSGGSSLAVGANTITVTVTAADGTTTTTYTVTVTRAAASGGGGGTTTTTTTTTTTPTVTIANVPVSKAATPDSSGTVTVSVAPPSTSGGPAPTPVTVALTWAPKAFTEPVTVTVTPVVPATTQSTGTTTTPGTTTPGTTTPAPIAGGFKLGSTVVQVNITTSSGQKVTSFAAPLVIHISASEADQVPAYSENGTSWTQIPRLSSPSLPAGQPDGYYVNPDGSVDVYTRHATYYALLADAQAPTTPTLTARITRKYLRLAIRGAHDNVAVTGYVVNRNQHGYRATKRPFLALPLRPGRYFVVAHDAAWNVSGRSKTITVVRTHDKKHPFAVTG